MGTDLLGPSLGEHQVVARAALVAVGVAKDLHPYFRVDEQETGQAVQGGHRLNGDPVTARLELDRRMGARRAEAGLEQQIGLGGRQVGHGGRGLDDGSGYPQAVLHPDHTSLGLGDTGGRHLQIGGLHPAVENRGGIHHLHLHSGQAGPDHGLLDPGRQIGLSLLLVGGAGSGT